MNIISNARLIRRNARIAQYSGLAGMIILIAGMYVLFRYPGQFGIIWGTVLAGFILSQVGIYFTNRWGRNPRPDQNLNNALKGLSTDYSLYHYVTPTSHLLVGPAGVWVLLPRYQRGTITFEKNRFKQKGGGFLLNYLKIFGQEGLGRPELEVEAEKEAVTKFLKKHIPEDKIPPIQAALVFTDERAKLENLEEAPVPTLPKSKLKEFIRKSAKTKSFSMDRVNEINHVIGEYLPKGAEAS
ncbi:MAG: hypothetical protein ACM3PY_10675 [Omnitrophica WOR_2 bacterium]